MVEILEITAVMWIVAVGSFAPLGYFIYLFTKGNGESFGKSNPADHSVEHTWYYPVVNQILGTLLGEKGAAKSTETVRKPVEPAAQVSAPAPSRRINSKRIVRQ